MKYPKTVDEVLDENIKYKAETNKALETFKNSDPFQGTNRRKKILDLNKELAKSYKIKPPYVFFVPDLPRGSCCIRKLNLILLTNLSVITFLHEFGHILGKNERETCKWSINLFKKHFPDIYDKLEHKGHMLVKKQNKDDLKEDIKTGLSFFIVFLVIFGSFLLYL